MILKTPDTPLPVPSRAPGLSPGERLLLATMRDWASLRLDGERPGARVAATLAFRAGDRVAALFVAWMQAVERALRHPLRISCPHCGGVSIDEQRLIIACGLSPAAFELGERVLEPLLIETQAAMVLGRALNAALRAEGLALPMRLGSGTPPAFAAERPTLH